MSLKYFKSNLNYTLANEDTSFELEILPEGARHVMAVAGSGGRVLPLLAKAPKLVSCVDVSQEQLYLNELRIESVRAFELADFLAFWGYPPKSADGPRRRELFDAIRLTEPAKAFFRNLFSQREWRTILYDGKWESTFAKLSSINRKLTGAKGLALFSALTLEEHTEYLERHFPWKQWSLVLLVLGNAGVFNALLYKGHFPKKNISESFLSFYQKCFERLFKQGPARENFFLQLAFFGKVVFSEGCPVECRPDVYAKVKHNLSRTEVRYRLGSIIDEAANTPVPIDFLSLSDVPSYFSGTTEKNFLQDIKKGLSPNALAVVRNYLHVPEDVDATGYANISVQFEKEAAREKVQVYLIDVYRREA